MTGTNPAPPKGSETSNRRSEARQPSSCTIELTLDPGSIEGTVQDVSAHGMAFYAEGPLRVVLQIKGEEEPRLLGGRLVRVESVTDERSVFAVRFDKPVDPTEFSRD